MTPSDPGGAAAAADTDLPAGARPRRPAASLLSGTAWSALDFWMQQAVALLVFVAVGNVAGPAAIGALTLGQLATALVMTLLLDGFSDALVQRRSLEPAHVDTVFLLLAGLGIAAGLLLWLAAPFCAWLFGEPELTRLMPLLALGLPCVGISATYQALLQRALRFRALALRSLVAQALGLACALLLLRAGAGVYALVGYFLATRLVDAVVLALISRRLPGRHVSRQALAEVVGYGKHRVGNQMIGFAVMQVDRFSTGLFLGPAAVGVYAVAERISSALINGLSGVVMRVAFPVLSARQAEPAQLREALGDALVLGNLLAFPAFLGMALVSGEVMQVLFSPAWAEAAAPLAVLAIAGITHAPNYVLTACTNAQGRPDIAVRYSLVVMAMRLVASLAAAPHGVLAVALANLAVSVAATPVVVLFLRRQVAGLPALVLHSLLVPALPTLPMAVATVAAGMALHASGTAPLLVLAGKIAAGAVAYAAVLALLAPQRLRRLLGRAG